MATEEVKIAPKSDWPNMSVQQLYDTKYQMSDRYYNLLNINASFAPQYLKFIQELDALILVRQNEKDD
jgi:hypothetical protein